MEQRFMRTMLRMNNELLIWQLV